MGENFTAKECTDTPTPSRTARAKEAVQDLSSLAPPRSRGIDARSLAAKPPTQGFTITREHGGSDSYRGRGRGIDRGRVGAPLRSGGAPFRSAGGDRSGGRGVGRGGTRGGRGGRGRGRGNGQKRGRRKPIAEENEEPPLTDEEIRKLDESDGGGPPHPYEPRTSLEYLLGKGAPAVPTSQRGVLETMVHKFEVATNNEGLEARKVKVHEWMIKYGKGTFFESLQAKDWAVGAKKQHLSEEQKDEIERHWVAGQYDGPKFAEKDDIIGQVESYTRRNGTYLPEDMRKLQEKLKALLPPNLVKPSGSQPKDL